eukprot:gnl/Carplike_NY0171/5720_a7844_281.p1 GENE.gnl/Carplike_NY0171/5720_a7844_281~~gnl/Carplike_NY0171/5720_a7844_281.p1  ORF type:complete len:193 (+),score=19.30 gnl/Carplike_NY0171/5720_a7844_281:363-941(+)
MDILQSGYEKSGKRRSLSHLDIDRELKDHLHSLASIRASEDFDIDEHWWQTCLRYPNAVPPSSASYVPPGYYDPLIGPPPPLGRWVGNRKKHKARKKFDGKWRLTGISHSEDYVDAETDAYLKIHGYSGEYRFGYCRGEIHNFKNDGDKMEFIYEGFDELDEDEGDGTCVLEKDGTLRIEFGNGCTFSAHRM